MRNLNATARVAACTLLVLCGFSPLAGKGNFATADLRCEQATNPVGIDTPTPRLSWRLYTSERNTTQSAYRIIVSDSPDAITRGVGTMWDSKKVRSDASLLIPYSGAPLAPATRYYWSVCTWDASGQHSAWAPTASFTTGLYGDNAWGGAQWIALEDDIPSQIVTDGMGRSLPEIGHYKLPLLRKTFETKQGVIHATAYVCGLGQFELYLNGQKVGNHFLDPAWTKYDKSAQYVAFDVTHLLGTQNAVGVMLGNGFFNIPNERYRKFDGSYGAPKLLVRLDIEYADHSRQTILSDGSWRATQGPITFSSIYGGEDYDASLEQPGWSTYGYDDSAWNAAQITHFDTHLRAQQSTPITIRQQIPTYRKYRNGRGHYLYDLGQNASGIVRITLRGAGRHTVKLYPGELQNSDSTVSQRSSGAPYILSYTMRGDGQPETWQPRFTYYGFRYVEVEGAVPEGAPNPDGLPEIVRLDGLHTTNSAEQVGSFNCSNPLFNRIYTLIDWAIRSNFSSVFTDCPHREKLGWLEQSHLIGPSIQYGYDISRAFPKIVRDMAEAQHDNGMVPTIAPQYTVFSDGFIDTPEWGSAYILIPWYLYQWYGDRRPVEENYDQMSRYIDYLSSKANGHIIAYGLGDWCDLGPGEPAFAQLTSNSFSATAIYYYDICTMRHAAQLLGKQDDAARFEALAAEVKKSFNDRFFDPSTQKYDRNSQAANAMALYMGLVEPEHKSIVLKNLIDDIRSRGNALTAGDIGYRYVVQALADNGASEVLFDMNSQYDKPGYGFQLAMGETSLAESWQSCDYLSHNHCMLGHLYSWLFASVGGIDQTETSVAYKRLRINPQQVGDLHSAQVSLRGPYGLIRTDWNDTPERYTLTVEIPANSSAEVYLPTLDVQHISESGSPIAQNRQINVLRTEGAKSVLSVGSGLYRFVVEK